MFSNESSDLFFVLFQSAALNHWASLTIGLLNREYTKDEKERKMRQLMYLNEREQFLDQQLNGFVQDPVLREVPDAASTLSSNFLKNMKVCCLL